MQRYYSMHMAISSLPHQYNITQRHCVFKLFKTDIETGFNQKPTSATPKIYSVSGPPFDLQFADDNNYKPVEAKQT